MEQTEKLQQLWDKPNAVYIKFREKSVESLRGFVMMAVTGKAGTQGQLKPYKQACSAWLPARFFPSGGIAELDKDQCIMILKYYLEAQLDVMNRIR